MTEARPSARAGVARPGTRHARPLPPLLDGEWRCCTRSSEPETQPETQL